MSSAILRWLILWLIFLSVIALANLIFFIGSEHNIICNIMSRKFPRKLSDKEKIDILNNLKEALKSRGLADLESYLSKYYEVGEFSGSKKGRQRHYRIKQLKDIQFTTFLIDLADDLGLGLDFIFSGLGPPAPLYRTPKQKK